MNRKLKGYLLAGVIFLAGGAAGAGVSAAVTQRHFAHLMGEPNEEAMRERRLAALASRLDLSDAQLDRVRAIMAQHGPEHESAMREMFERCGGRLRQQRSVIDQKIGAVLDEEQRREFEQLSERHRRRFLRAPRPRRSADP